MVATCKKILVTGAAGRLGNPAARALHEKGYEVTGLDVVAPADSPFPFRQVNLLDVDQARDALRGMDVLVHLANHPGLFALSPQVTFNENVAMNMNVFQGAAEGGVKRIVFASSLQLLGSHPDGRTVTHPPPAPAYPLDSTTPAAPANAYALSKEVGETMLRYFALRCGMDGVAIRFPYIRPSLAKGFSGAAAARAGLIREGFSVISVADAVDLLLAVLESDLPGFRVYLPGVSMRCVDTPLPELIRLHYPELSPDTASLVDNRIITAETGWEPRSDYGS